MTRKRILSIAAFALAGGIVGFFGASTFEEGLRAPGASELLLLVALAYAAVGLINLVMSANRRLAARAMHIEAAPDEDIAPERALLRLSAVVFLLAAAAMALPALGRTPLGLSGEVAFAIVLGLLVVESVLNWRAWTGADELMRRLTGEVCAITFFAFQLILFVWAVGAQFGVIGAVRPLDLIAVMMLLYLFIAGVVGMRRGFG